MLIRLSILLLLLTMGLYPMAGRAEEKQAPKKIVLLAGKKSHGPGVHEYEKSVQLLKVMLDHAANVSDLQVEYHLNGWPENPATLDDADAIVTISDGQDGDRYSPVPWMTAERMPVIEKQMKRGCGLMTFHFSTFAPDKYGQEMLDWVGGYFDWQDDTGQRNWYSAIRTLETQVVPGERKHPVLRGMEPFALREEFYYKLRFREHDARWQPILLVPELADAPADQTVAWAMEREDGGRGFGTSLGHFYDNWQQPSFRKLILNAIVWIAHGKVPQEGVEARYYSDEEVQAALHQKPRRVAIVTGHNHTVHKWRETTLALEDILRRDVRLQVDTFPDPEFLATKELHEFDAVVLNYANWQKPGLSDAAKENFLTYLKAGGGLSIIHFSNGAFHYSLPEAADSDWPEYRNICRRVWDHRPKDGTEKSGHDAFGEFQVEIVDREHEITRGMQAFTTEDELYFRQKGTGEIHVLASARSKVTGKDEPMAFVYDYGQARVFQTVLGHAANSLLTPGTASLVRRGAAWTAGLAPLPAVEPQEKAE